MQVKLVDIVAQYRDIKEELFKTWEEVLEKGRLYLGENVCKFEEKFANFLGVNYVIGVGSGTDALYLALKALGINKKDEVIVPSFTFIATVEAIILAGAEPVFADISPQTYTISPLDIKKKITQRTKVILPVHLYGHPAMMQEILEIARKYNLKVLEDSAQAHGALCLMNNNKWTKVGSIGDISIFSFYFSKNLGAFGEAGAVATNNQALAEKVRLLREHGQVTKYTHKIIGLNSRLDELQAAVLRLKLRFLNDWNNKRRQIAKYYKENLKDLPIHLPEESTWARHVYHLYVIRCDEKIRDELFSFLRSQGIEVSMHYPIPCHLQEALSHKKNIHLPLTEKYAKQIISLPMHPHLKQEELDFVIEKMHRFFR